jgi:hypothetical protein
MPENPHDREDLRREDEKVSEEKENESENGAWSEDQKKRSYYYDDACGYEIYDADEDAEGED